MKYLFFIFILLVYSCQRSDGPNKIYELELTYNAGDRDTMLFVGSGENYFHLKHGDFTGGCACKGVIASGVRSYRVLNIRLPYDSSEVTKAKSLR